MAVAFDANFLSILLSPGSSVPLDPATNAPIELSQQRVQELVERLSTARVKIVVPWPALAEFMIFAYPNHSLHIEDLRGSPSFDLSEFGQMAAIELTELTVGLGKPKRAQREETWAKLKFDRQIIAIAIAKRCSAIYSTDKGVLALALECKMDAFGVHDLPKPQAKQISIFDADDTAESGIKHESEL